MLPFFTIAGHTFSSYAVAGAVGFFLGLLYIACRSRKYQVDRDNAVYIYVFASLGALLGAKVFYLITVFQYLAHDIPLLWNDFSTFASRYLEGGFVFYGGLFGAILTAKIMAKQYHTELGSCYPVLVPAILLFASCGRVGCFLEGCCYGKQTNFWWGVMFNHSLFAPHNVRLVPVQLFEAAADIFILFIILHMNKRKELRIYELSVYLGLYACFRFFIEFFRGDGIRGAIGPLSLSQWVSLFLLGILGIYGISLKRSYRVENL